ncbi:MAG: histidinol-phosphatase HisJ family protein [Planctomycetota bacterium]|nr:MAG: histidinol-phosphatase HisJ family protein [Planctomycetota bacterium]
MAIYDQHVHTRFSVDSQADPGDIVRRAVDLGLAGVTFTDHWDTHPSEWPECIYDYRELAETISALRDQFDRQIFIGHGIEVCYQPQQMDQILKYLDGHSFDLVMLSAHWFAGRALHKREHWNGLDVESGTRKYLQTVREAARCVLQIKQQGHNYFHILGHIDLVKRYTHRYFDTYDIEPHKDLIDEILVTCIDADLVPEINVSSLRKSIPETMPPEWCIRRYAELGGKAVALGSDAHQAEDVGSMLEDGAELLKRLGIRTQAVFKESKRYDEPL